nr:hypothetical protein [Nostoc sp. ChiSLP01]
MAFACGAPKAIARWANRGLNTLHSVHFASMSFNLQLPTQQRRSQLDC